MKRHTLSILVVAVAVYGVAAGTFAADDAELLEGVVARLDAHGVVFEPGKPVPVEFKIQNTTAKAVLLTVPGVERSETPSAVGLPLEHVFSGQVGETLVLSTTTGRSWSDPEGVGALVSAPDMVLGPFASVGVTLDISRLFPEIGTPGTYRLQWRPYRGMLVSNEVVIEVNRPKDAIIMTDQGDLRIRFEYNAAPNHVANFLELTRQGFYNQKTFHSIIQGMLIQGGDPNGDGTGVRPDGKTLEPEFSSLHHDRGTVSMSRIEGDPNSASCQFFITATDMPSLDGRYTIFGHLVGEESYSTLDRLMSLPIADPTTGRPERKVWIRAVRIVDADTEASVEHRAVDVVPETGMELEAQEVTPEVRLR